MIPIIVAFVNKDGKYARDFDENTDRMLGTFWQPYDIYWERSRKVEALDALDDRCDWSSISPAFVSVRNATVKDKRSPRGRIAKLPLGIRDPETGHYYQIETASGLAGVDHDFLRVLLGNAADMIDAAVKDYMETR